MTSAKILYLARYRMPHAIMSLQPEFTKHLIGVDRTCIASPVPKEELWPVFEKYGIAELYTKKGEAFLNDIAKGLGFKDSKELHENYKNLHSRNLGTQKEAQDIFLQKRAEKSDMPNLADIRLLYSEENKRILKEIGNNKGQEFYKKNTHYASLMSYISTEFGESLGSSQVLNAVVNVVQEKVKEKMSSALEENPSASLSEQVKQRIQKKAFEVFANKVDSIVENEIKEKTETPAAAIEQALDGVRQAVYAEKAATILRQDREKKKDRQEKFGELFDNEWTLKSLIKLINDGFQKDSKQSDSVKEAYMAAFEVKIALMAQQSTDLPGMRKLIEKIQDKKNNNLPKDKALSIINAQLNKVEKAKEKAKDKSLEVLTSSYGNNIKELTKLQDLIVKGNEDESNFTLAQVIDFQKKYLEVQNELLVEIQEINNKLSTLSADKSPGVLEKRIALLGQTKKLQDVQSKFEATLIGLPFEVKDFYSEKYKEGIKELGDFKESEILEALNNVVADKDKDKGKEKPSKIKPTDKLLDKVGVEMKHKIEEATA